MWVMLVFCLIRSWKQFPDWRSNERCSRWNSKYLSVFSPNAGKCRKNMDQYNSEYGHFLRNGCIYLKSFKIIKPQAVLHSLWNDINLFGHWGKVLNRIIKQMDLFSKERAIIKKQPFEIVLQSMYSDKFHNIHRETDTCTGNSF